MSPIMFFFVVVSFLSVLVLVSWNMTFLYGTSPTCVTNYHFVDSFFLSGVAYVDRHEVVAGSDILYIHFCQMLLLLRSLLQM